MEKKFEKRIISFVDILGFGAKVIKNADNPVILNKIVSDVSKLKSTLESKAKDNRGYKLKSQAFTDCIVREREYFPGVLRSEMLSLINGQILMIYHGVLLRGAITHGSHYMDEESGIMVSPAMVQAYKLENKAVHPRIVVDNLTIAQHFKFNEWRLPYEPEDEDARAHFELLRQDPSDESLYLDYLTNAYSLMDFEVGHYLEFLDIHKKLIEKGFQENQGEGRDESKVRAKYDWLMRYHNMVIRECLERFPEDTKPSFSGMLIS